MKSIELTGLLFKIHKAGYGYIVVSYAGENDSGDRENIYLMNAEYPEECHDTYMFDEKCIDLRRSESILSKSESDDLCDFMIEYMTSNNPGWEDNEGSQGTVVIGVDNREISVEHTTFERVSHSSSCSSTLLDLTLGN